MPPGPVHTYQVQVAYVCLESVRALIHPPELSSPMAGPDLTTEPLKKICRLVTRALWTVIILFSTLSLVPEGITFSEIRESVSVSSAVDVRNGPGSFYPRSARLMQDTPVVITDRLDGWVQIESGSVSGWIPSIAVHTDTRNSERNNGFESLRERFDRAFEEDKQRSEPYVSEAQVVAAVKGFIENHIAASQGELIDMSDYLEYRYDTGAYLRFRQSRISDRQWRSFQRSYRLSSSQLQLPPPDLELVGWAAGNRIAQIGVYDDPRLRTYLNHVAMFVTENSHRPDIPVSVIILDTDDIAGYAVPGGLIFISLGAVRMMRTEAEFASFIGHEIAHLVFSHGQQEMEKRGTRIRASDAVLRMEQYIHDAGMTDERYQEVAARLQQEADALYEYLIADRLHEYEAEADRYGMIYTSRAGYRGYALYNVLERISLLHREPESERKSAWYGDTIENRLEALRRELDKDSHSRGSHFTQEWDLQTRHLRN